MRNFALFLLVSPLIPSAAAAWDFTPGLPCLLTHAEPGIEVELTHDPNAPLFTITLRRDAPWPEGGTFSIAFAGGLTISTNRQVLSDGGRALTVADRGFGNVIAGMVTSPSATARLGDVAEEFSLNGAGGPAQDFNACAPQPSV